MTQIRERFRIATYNVHRCRGLDRRHRPGRIVEVLRELDADIVALQEVWNRAGTDPLEDQARFIASTLGLVHVLGETRKLRGAPYGNVVLSRFPVLGTNNFDITIRGFEERGCLRADVSLGPERVLHVFNVHLGTAYLERRRQARRLLADEILGHPELAGPRVVLGDFNEWTRGLTTRLLAHHFQSADLVEHLRRRKTYPGVFPLLHLDHVYYDRTLRLRALRLHRSRTALIASDHLPLVADFEWSPVESGDESTGERVDASECRDG